MNGEPQRFIEEVALTYDGDECLIWPFSRDESGYGQIARNGKPVHAHTIVCESAHGERPSAKHEVAHECGKGHEGCVSKGHLSWKTHVENEADKLVHGTINRGSRNGQAKLSETDVAEIIAARGSASQYALAKKFGVSQPMICAIHTGKRWSWLHQEN